MPDFYCVFKTVLTIYTHREQLGLKLWFNNITDIINEASKQAQRSHVCTLYLIITYKSVQIPLEALLNMVKPLFKNQFNYSLKVYH